MPTSSNNPHLPFGENKNAEWYGKDIVSVKQFNRADLEYVFGVAHEMRGLVERVVSIRNYLCSSVASGQEIFTNSPSTAIAGEGKG